jgi:hypothetical protein
MLVFLFSIAVAAAQWLNTHPIISRSRVQFHMLLFEKNKQKGFFHTNVSPGNTKGGSITVPLTSYLTDLKSGV